MRRVHWANLGIIIAASVAWLPQSSYCGTFVDDFEGSSLDPFWSTRAQAGEIVFPSTEIIHGGGQGVKFSSIRNAGEKYIWLVHDFDEPVYGKASVWMYDTGADELSSNYIGISLRSPEVNTQLFTFDYDLGPADGGEYYYYNSADSLSSFASGIDRTKDWHELSITSHPDMLRFEIDGETVHENDRGTPFDSIILFMEGPTWRPAYDTYFDDFSFTPIPEPSGLMLAAGCGMVFCLRTRRARRVLP